MELKYFSMFSGIGGFEQGIMQADPTAECVGYSEIDKYAIEIYKKHFPKHKNYGNARNIIPEILPYFNLLVGGFPCQSFSIAGKRQGFNDTRGTLFFEIARILQVKRPEYVLLENVKGLLSHDNFRTITTIFRVLTELGYMVSWEVLNSKYFGVPQNRERIFIFGFREGSRKEIFPIRQSYKQSAEGRFWQAKDIAGTVGTKNNSPNWRFDASTTLISNSALNRKWEVRKDNIVPPLRANHDAGRNDLIISGIKVGTLRTFNNGEGFEENRENISPTILSRAREDGSGQPIVKLYHEPCMLTEARTEEAKKIRRESRKKGVDFSPRRAKELVPRKDFLGNCVTANQSKEGLLIEKERIRRLTPIECERLQGFDDDYTEGISDSQRYKVLGNAVTVNVVRAIIQKLTQ